MLSRRKTLALIGGGTIAAAAGFLTTRTPNAALAPWEMAGSYGDPRLDALSYALLAPNPHNLQPWLVELIGEDGIRLHHDKARRLPATDPLDRQITIGMGCFLEQLSLAAGTSGFGTQIDLYPDGEAGPIAEIRLSDGAQVDPLAAAIPQRRTCKEPFEDRMPDPASLKALSDYATVYSAPEMVETLKAMTWEAHLIETLTPHTMQESIDLMRIGKAEIIANPDGIDIGGPFFDSLNLVGALSRESLEDPDSMNFKQGLAIYEDMLKATPAYAVLKTDGNARADQIAAGRNWLRLNLACTTLGLALHPVSQCLQEYPEMSELYSSAHALLANEGETVQMIGRLGYGPEVPRTPRWPLDAKRLDV
jgi:hypothetical protein